MFFAGKFPFPFVWAKYYFIINVNLKCLEDQVGKKDKKALGVRYMISVLAFGVHMRMRPRGFKYFLHGVGTMTAGHLSCSVIAHVFSKPKRQVRKRLYTTWIRTFPHSVIYVS